MIQHIESRGLELFQMVSSIPFEPLRETLAAQIPDISQISFPAPIKDVIARAVKPRVLEKQLTYITSLIREEGDLMKPGKNPFINQTGAMIALAFIAMNHRQQAEEKSFRYNGSEIVAKTVTRLGPDHPFLASLKDQPQVDFENLTPKGHQTHLEEITQLASHDNDLISLLYGLEQKIPDDALLSSREVVAWEAKAFPHEDKDAHNFRFYIYNTISHKSLMLGVAVQIGEKIVLLYTKSEVLASGALLYESLKGHQRIRGKPNSFYTMGRLHFGENHPWFKYLIPPKTNFNKVSLQHGNYSDLEKIRAIDLKELENLKNVLEEIIRFAPFDEVSQQQLKKHGLMIDGDILQLTLGLLKQINNTRESNGNDGTQSYSLENKQLYNLVTWILAQCEKEGLREESLYQFYPAFTEKYFPDQTSAQVTRRKRRHTNLTSNKH